MALIADNTVSMSRSQELMMHLPRMNSINCCVEATDSGRNLEYSSSADVMGIIKQ
jgi:hypothetical protein